MDTNTLLDRALERVRKDPRWVGAVAVKACIDPSQVKGLLDGRDERVMNAVFELAGMASQKMIAQTNVVRIVRTAIDRAASAKRLYVLYGPTGCGKTFAARWVIDQLDNADIVYVRINEDNKRNRSALYMDIARRIDAIKMNRDAVMSFAYPIMRRLKMHCDTNQVCLVIDEAQKLHEQQFEALRDMFDESRISIVMLGSTVLSDRLYSEKLDGTVFGQFIRRIDDKYELAHSTPGDVKAFWSMYGVELALREAKEIAGKIERYGDIDTLVRAARKITSRHSEGELSWNKVGAGNILDAIERVIAIQRMRVEEEEAA